jgi:hypothetical protein
MCRSIRAWRRRKPNPSAAGVLAVPSDLRRTGADAAVREMGTSVLVEEGRLLGTNKSYRMDESRARAALMRGP